MSNVTKDLILRYRTEGEDRARRIAEELTRTNESLKRAIEGVGAVSDASRVQINNWSTSYRNLNDRLDGSSKALRSFFGDLKALNAGMRADAGSAEDYAEALGKIQANLTAMGRPSGSDTGMAAQIAKRFGLYEVASTAKESAAAIEREYARIQQRFNAISQGIGQRYGSGTSFFDLGAKASDFGATTDALREFAREAQAADDRLDSLRRKFDDGYSSSQRLAVELDDLAEAERAGIAVTGGYEAAMTRLVLKYDDAARAAAEMAAAERAALSDRQAMIVATRNLADQQAAFQRLGLGGPSARESGATFSALDDRARNEERASRIIAEIDPITAARARLNDEIRTYNELNAAGLLTDQQLAQGMQVAEKRFDDLAKAQAGVGKASELGAHELQNMSYQLNDIVVSLASGQSPFTVITQQGAQMAQLFGPGATVQGALSTVGGAIKEFLLNPLTLAVLGFAAAAGAADLLYSAFMSGAPSMEKSLEKQGDLIARMTERYEGLGETIESIERMRAAGFEIEGGAAGRDIAKLIKDEADRLMVAYTSISTYRENILSNVTGAVEADTAAGLTAVNGLMGDFAAALQKGERPVEDLRRSLVELYGKAMAEGDVQTQKAIEAAFQQTDALSKLGNMADQTAKALREAQPEQIAARENAKLFAEAMDDLGAGGGLPVGEIAQIRADFEKAFAAASNMGEEMAASEAYARRMADALRDSTDELENAQNALANLGLDPDQRRLAEIDQEFAQRKRNMEEAQADSIELDNLEKTRIATREAAQIELERERVAERENHDLAMREIGVRDAATKAELAAERERIRLRGEGYTDEGVIEQKAAEAAALSRAQSESDLTESLRQRALQEQDTIDSMNLEIESIGKTAGEVARLQEEYRLLAEYKEAAYQQGRDYLTDDETTAIRDRADAVGLLTDRLAQQKLLQDIMDERGGINLSDDERQIRDRLLGAGVDVESANGKVLASQMRVNDEMMRTRELAKDVWDDFIDGATSGEGVLESLGNALAGFSKKMASLGADKLFEMVYGNLAGLAGGGAAPTVSFGAPATRPGTSFTSGSQSYGYGTAPVAPVERSALPAITKMSNSLEAAAKAIRTIESGSAGGNYGALGPRTNSGDRAYGAYQIMGNNIPSWSKAALGYQVSTDQFLKSIETQDKIFQHRFGMYMQKYGPEGASRAWFAGEGGMRNFKAQDVVGTSVGGYGSRFGQIYAQHSGSPGYIAPTRVSSQVDFAAAVETGTVNATRRIASGGVPGASAWGAQFNDAQPTSAMVTAPGSTGFMGQMQQFMQTPLFQGGLTALSSGMAGYQSGDAMGGALNGALAGLATGNPLMAVVGGISGLVGGLLGGSSKKKEEKRQKQMAADQAWSDNYNQFLEFKDVIYRTPQGDLSGRLTDLARTLEEFDKIADATGKGENQQAIEDAREQLAVYGDFLKEGFRDAFQPMVEDMASGRGLDGAFSKAREAVLNESEAYRGFIEDTKTAFDFDRSGASRIDKEFENAKRGIETARRRAGIEYEFGTEGLPFGGAVTGRREITSAENAGFDARIEQAQADRDAALAEWEESVKGAQERYDNAVRDAVLAARESLLRIVSGDVVERTEIEDALSEAQGAASGLMIALKDLGMSAAEAGLAIDEALLKRTELLRTEFVEGIQDQIDALDDKGYLAEFRELIEEQANLMKDAGLLGVDAALINEYFTKAAQDLVDGAELSGDAFEDLIDKFPELADVVKEFAKEVEDLQQTMQRRGELNDRFYGATMGQSTAGRLYAFDRSAWGDRQREFSAGGGALLNLEAALAAEKVDLIKGMLREAQEAQRAEIADNVSALESFTTGLKAFRKSLLLDNDLSPLNAQERLAEAERQFRDVAKRAAAGDEDAQRELQAISQEYLDEARDFYASSEAYYKIFDEVDRTLANTEKLADEQLAAAKRQLELLEKQLDVEEDTKDEIAKLNVMLKAATDAMIAAALKAGLQVGADGTVTLPGGNSTTPGSGGPGSFSPKNELESFLGVQYQAILGRNPDASGVAFYQGLRDKGYTADQLIAMIKASPEAQAKGYLYGGYTGAGARDEWAGFVHKEEVVWDADAVQRWGGPAAVDSMRLSAPKLLAPDVSLAMPSRSDREPMTAEDAANLRDDVSRLVEAVVLDGQATREVLTIANAITRKIANNTDPETRV